MKDRTPTQHTHNVIYQLNCPENGCDASYIGETARRMYTRICEHGGKDKNSQMYKHAVERKHQIVEMEDIKILSTGAKHRIGRKITEALYIKNIKPSLNVQEMSVPLKLF